MVALLPHLIEQAYEVEDYQLAGGPTWGATDWYEVLAKADGAPGTHQVRVMLQQLLAERFQLKLHRETRMMAGYVLSVDKGGPKLPAPKTELPPDSPGVIQVGGGLLWVRGGTLGRLATGLRLELGKPVVDETKIEGKYDLRLRFDDSEAMGTGPGAAPTGVGSVFSALHEIGLKLEAQKVPIDVLVIDGAERPSEN